MPIVITTDVEYQNAKRQLNELATTLLSTHKRLDEISENDKTYWMALFIAIRNYERNQQQQMS